MNTSIKIKVCGMKYADNIQELAQLPIDFMGFIFYPQSKRYAGDILTYDSIANLPSTITKVAVFVNESIENILTVCKKFNINHVQLHGSESVAHCANLKSEGLKLIKAFSIDGNFDFQILENYETSCDYFLFDTKTVFHGGSGLKFDWEILKKYNQKLPFFLSGGIGKEDSPQIKALSNMNIFAVDINSKFEISAGLKDVEMIKSFVENLKN